MNLLIGFILGPGRNSGTEFFFHVVFRFYDELPALRAPSSSLAGSNLYYELIDRVYFRTRPEFRYSNFFSCCI